MPELLIFGCIRKSQLKDPYVASTEVKCTMCEQPSWIQNEVKQKYDEVMGTNPKHVKVMLLCTNCMTDFMAYANNPRRNAR